MEKNTLKSLLKIANKLDTLGLTSEADLLDGIICKIAANIIDPKTKQPVKMTSQLSIFLDSYIANGSLKVPDKFSAWLLEGGAGAKNVSNFFNPSLNSIWADYGFQYIKTLPKLGSSIDFYLNLAQLVPGWNQDEADSTKQYDIKVIYKNLYDYNRGREDLMRSSKSYSTGEQIVHGVGSVATSPYTAYQALQNPSVKRETKEFLDTYSTIEATGTLPQHVSALILGAPLSFANALVDFQTGEYLSGILNFVDAVIGVLTQYFGGKFLLQFSSMAASSVRLYFYKIVIEAVTSAASNKAKNEILNSNMPEPKKKDALLLVTEDRLKPVVEGRFREKINKS